VITNSRHIEAIFELLIKHVGNSGSGVVGSGFWEDISNTSLDHSQVAEALCTIRASNRIDIFPQSEGERPLIAVRPARVRCPDCRQWHSGYEDWDDHFDACQKQQEKLHERGLLYQWKLAQPREGGLGD
jgi:hypothetical protein